ncbi:hypothetical protein WSK_2392 [Novosphingobium sp. Rr 2-17]|uniref:hypothetical protein n=1 Tax=Novosphingobium sp. Rr 2-17 TaxID=555793 RepID=UPI000269A517|nr:hypothetical protein [Novosphingobium sp. Rr 2-17]EIZ78849.1 hypothetical protein WSK_2392 [Novosphingobium sp. Rr 2-17]
MAEQWYKCRRAPDGGISGYRPIHWKGWLAALVYGIAAMLSVILPLLATGLTLLGYLLAAALIAVSTAAFLMLMRRRSDWQG